MSTATWILASGAFAIVLVWLVALAEGMLRLHRLLRDVEQLLQAPTAFEEEIRVEARLWAHTSPCGEPRPPSPTGTQA